MRDNGLRRRAGVPTGKDIVEQPLGASDRVVRHQHFVAALHGVRSRIVLRGRTAELKLEAPAVLRFRGLQPQLEGAQFGESHGQVHRDVRLA